MPTQTLGKVKLTPRGAYDPAATYVPLDIVSYGGGSYCALKNVTGVTPTGDDVNYQLLAESGADGKSAYQYAVDGGYTGTEAEFAAKLAEDIPTTLPNPNALTFIGAVTGSYDGSEPLTVEIPSGGGGSTVELDTTLSEAGKAADAKAVGDALADKQNTISDLEAIRTGAAKGTTALQSVPSTYRTASEQDTIDDGKVDKVTGKGLSSNDYTDAAKAKVDALAPVATSGSYNDLTNKPTIPTALPNPNALTFTGAVTGSYDGSEPVTVNIPSGGGGSSGGSGKAKTQILIDQEITELTASLSVTLEHDFHNLIAIINCGSDGAALTAGSDGTAVASKIGLMIDTTSFNYNSRKVAYVDTPTTTWQTRMIGAEWSDDLSVFKRGFKVEVATGASNKYYDFPFGGTSAMYGTLETDDNAPRTGKTANIVVNGAYLNVGTRVVLWGEYYE